jgi:hypothetical protein
MRPSNPKFSFGPGFSVAKKILSLVVLFCFLVFFSLVYAGGPGPQDPVGEHPWDELNSKPNRESPKPPDTGNILIFPCDSFGRWIIIHSPQVKNGNIEKSQIQSSDRNRGKFFIFF